MKRQRPTTRNLFLMRPPWFTDRQQVCLCSTLSMNSSRESVRKDWTELSRMGSVRLGTAEHQRPKLFEDLFGLFANAMPARVSWNRCYSWGSRPTLRSCCQVDCMALHPPCCFLFLNFSRQEPTTQLRNFHRTRELQPGEALWQDVESGWKWKVKTNQAQLWNIAKPTFFHCACCCWRVVSLKMSSLSWAWCLVA